MEQQPLQLSYTQEILDALVRRILAVDDVTLGGGNSKYIARYRGHIYDADTAAAYDKLNESLKPYALTPLFRNEDGRHAVYIIPGLPKAKPSNPWINLVLFILTFASVLLAGATYGLADPLPSDPLQAVLALIQRGWPFAVSMLAILGAHEFGHYLAGRAHGVHVTLPYFIPLPFTPLGTMGAFINMKEIPKNRRVLLDISVAGPLAGLVVAIPVLILGLSLSTIERIPLSIPQGVMYTLEGNSLLYLGLKYLMFGQLLPQPASLGGLSPVLYWIRYFFTGLPSPLGGLDVTISPVAWAGWAGLLITALNLIPAGQLDGGHLFQLVFGQKTARRLLPFILVATAVLGLVWSGWWLWMVLIFFFGRLYAEPLDDITPLDGRRKALAWLALILFVLLFTPVPLITLM